MLHSQESPIQRLNQVFDVDQLIDLPWDIWSPILDKTERQLCLTHPANISGKERLTFGNGKLADSQREEPEFSEFLEELKNHYVYSVYKKVQVMGDNLGVGIGRVRYMMLYPTTCLSYHIDADEFRFHIPLQTNPKAMFIIDDKVYRMSEVGHVYKLQTNVWHTAVNASLNQPRLHLVFSTFQK